jgi:hypothetical protein
VAEQADSRVSLLGGETWHSEDPQGSRGRAILLAALLVAEAALVWRALHVPISPALVAMIYATVCVGLLVVSIVRQLVETHNTRYELANDTLTIIRGMARWVIPLTAIEDIAQSRDNIPSGDADLPESAQMKRRLREGESTHLATNLPVAQSVAVHTAARTYYASPQRPGDFRAALLERRAMAQPVQGSEPGEDVFAPVRQPVAAALLFLAVIANASLYAYIAWWYPALPDVLAHAAPEIGQRWRDASALLWLPHSGLLILAGDVFLALLRPLRRPTMTLTLLWCALVVQMLLWAAFLQLLP